MRILFILFIIIPIAEMWLLIKVGEQIGASATILLVLATAVLGVALLKQQGLSTLLRANQRLEKGELPAEELLSGFCLAVGGALLLTPGFLTDTFGFICLLPMTRALLIRRLMKHSLVRMQGAHFQSGFHSGPQSSFHDGASGQDNASRPLSGKGDTLEGDFRREED